MKSLRRIGLKNFHPRFYLAASISSSEILLSAEQTIDEHVWVQVGKVVFTTQPRGDGSWDKFWNLWDSSLKLSRVPNFKKLNQGDDEKQ